LALLSLQQHLLLHGWQQVRHLARREAPTLFHVCEGGGGEMNDRQFAAAHDKWLEPPDEDEDDLPEMDDMDFADIARQRKLDEEDWQAEKIRQKGED
jgi:hypothetical protein